MAYLSDNHLMRSFVVNPNEKRWIVLIVTSSCISVPFMWSIIMYATDCFKDDMGISMHVGKLTVREVDVWYPDKPH